MINKLIKFPSQNYLTNNNFIYTLSDQSIVSFCNFCITIIIVKFIGLEAFGKFSFLWMIAIYMNTFQQALIISPMFSIAPKINKHRLIYYYNGVFQQQIIFSIFSFLIIYFGLKILTILSWFNEVEKYSLSFAFAIAAIQIQNFVRRLFFSQKKVKLATVCDLISYSSLIILFFYFNYINEFNLNNIFWSYTVTFSLGILLGIPNLLLLKFKLNEIKNSFIINWPISKWLVLTSVMHWFSGNLWFVNAGVILGPFVFGVIRACVALGQIFNVFFQAMENIIPAKISKTFAEKGLLKMHNEIKKFTLQGFFFSFIIFLIILIFSKTLLELFYGSKTSEYYYILIFIGVLQLINYFQFPLSYALRTLKKTKIMAIAYATTAFITITSSKFIIAKFNLLGFFSGIFFTQIILTTILLLGYFHFLKKN